jgi:hypothetical protein
MHFIIPRLALLFLFMPPWGKKRFIFYNTKRQKSALLSWEGGSGITILAFLPEKRI